MKNPLKQLFALRSAKSGEAAAPAKKMPARELPRAIATAKRLAAKAPDALRAAPRALLDAPATALERRAARRTPSGFEFAFADGIDFLNPVHWDLLAAQTTFLSRDYLRVLERYSPENLAPRYVIIYSTGEPVAILLVQRIALSGDRIRKKSAEQKLIDKPLAKYGEHLLVCGNVFMWGARAFAFAQGADRKALWLAVGEAVYRLRRADKLLGESDLVMIKDFESSDAAATESLRLLGYRSVETEPDMVLSIRPEWKNLDDYLASLTSSYRSKSKKLRKDCETAGITFRLLSADEYTALAEPLHDLYLQVHEGQPLRLATLHPLYLPALAQVMGAKFRCRVAEKEGIPVGFVTCLLDNDTAVGYYIGYDKTANANAPIYLTLLNSCAGDAIEFGAKQLSIGRTALEPKANMGCKPVPVSCAIKHRVSAFNVLLSAVTNNATHEVPPERTPFKVLSAAVE